MCENAYCKAQYNDIHYRSKVWDHWEMSLFLKEKHCLFKIKIIISNPVNVLTIFSFYFATHLMNKSVSFNGKHEVVWVTPNFWTVVCRSIILFWGEHFKLRNTFHNGKWHEWLYFKCRMPCRRAMMKTWKGPAEDELNKSIYCVCIATSPTSYEYSVICVFVNSHTLIIVTQ